MKQFIRFAVTSIGLAIAISATLCVPVNGAINLQTGDRVRYEQHLDGTTAGGAFQFYHYASNQRFVTFCVEVEQSVGADSDYYVSLDSATNTSGRTVSDFGKWSFVRYAQGTLPGQGSMAGNRIANSVQLGLWQDMGYVNAPGDIGGGQEDWEHYRADRFGELASQYLVGANAHQSWHEAYAADTDWANRSGGQFVDVLRLWQNADLTGGAQDVLFSMPDDPQIVPEPTTLAIWTVVAGCGVFFRRSRRRNA